jgi:hypothetical protein
MPWKVDGKEVKEDLIDYISRLGLEEEDQEDIISEISDEVEVHVEEAGYTKAAVPLRNGIPSSLGSLTATFEGTGAPPTVPKFTHAVKLPSGKRMKVSTTFLRWVEKTPEQMARAKAALEEYMKSSQGAKGGKRLTRRR